MATDSASTWSSPKAGDYAFNEYHQPFSYDGVHWHPVAWARGYLASPLADTLTFPPFPGDQVWIGTQTPMSWDVDAVALIARWKAHPDVSVHTVGRTLGGRDMLRLTITGATSPHPLARRWVHYFANQHPGEHNSQWRLAGLVDWLLSDAGADVRQRQIVHVVLMMSPDGPANGWYRVNQQGVDMNRSYKPAGADKQCGGQRQNTGGRWTVGLKIDGYFDEGADPPGITSGSAGSRAVRPRRRRGSQGCHRR